MVCETAGVDERDRLLLDELQNDLPLVERPFAALGERIGMDAAEVLERIGRLRGEGVVRQISAIFDTRRLGYRSELVAVRSKEGRAVETAAVFSAHPGVTHNYRREHAFDIWFTIAVPPNSALGLDQTVELLGRLADVESIRPLPALRFFKIGVDLDMRGGRDPAAKKARRQPSEAAPDPASLGDREIAAIRALQTDLPAVDEPLAVVGEPYGFGGAELIRAGERMLATGQMRRFAAVLNHRTAGFVQNGMGVWKVDADRVEEAGRAMAAFRGVSHCYERPVYEDWPYRLFSMTHGRDKAECEAVLAAISAETGLSDYAVLYSTREYKKTRLRYFTPELEAWEAAHAPLADAARGA
jgi:DNA-binding Lrp family transcriptional regulator